jgi:hypothetical protein
LESSVSEHQFDTLANSIAGLMGDYVSDPAQEVADRLDDMKADVTVHLNSPLLRALVEQDLATQVSTMMIVEPHLRRCSQCRIFVRQAFALSGNRSVT